MQFLHIPSVVKAIILSLTILSVSFIAGPSIFETYYTQDDVNPDIAVVTNVLNQFLINNSESIVGYWIYQSILSSSSDNSTGYTPIYPFARNVESVWFSKNLTSQANEIISLNDTRLDTNQWRLSTACCPESIITSLVFADEQNTEINNLNIALIEDTKDLINQNNVTDNRLTADDEIQKKNIGQTFWTIQILFHNGLVIEITCYGSNLIFFQTELVGVRMNPNGLSPQVSIELNIIAYTLTFPHLVLNQFESSINQLIEKYYDQNSVLPL